MVIELLSETTAEMDRGEKKRVYQDQLRVPECFWYDPFSGELAGFVLTDRTYQGIEPDERGRLVSRALDLALVRWAGTYRNVAATWLRWATLEGRLLPTGGELAVAAGERADRLAARLRRLGIDPDEP